MNNEELKQIWDQTFERNELLANEATINTEIMKKSETVFSKLKRSLRTKFWIQSGISIFFCWLVFTLWKKDDTKIEESLLVFFLASFLLMAINKGVALLKVARFQRSTFPLKIGLAKTKSLLRQVCFLEGVVETIFASIVLTIWSYGHFRAREWFPMSLEVRAWVILGIFALSVWLMYAAFRKIQRRRYGPFMEGLQNCLDDLDDHPG